MRPLILLCFLLFSANVVFAEGEAPPSVEIDSIAVVRVRNVRERPELKGLAADWQDADRLALKLLVNYTGGKLKTDQATFSLDAGKFGDGSKIELISPDKSVFGASSSWTDDSSSANVELRFKVPPKSVSAIQTLKGTLHLQSVSETKEKIPNLRQLIDKELTIPGVTYKLFTLVDIKKREIILNALSEDAPNQVFLNFYDKSGEQLEKDFMGSRAGYLENGAMQYTMAFKDDLPEGEITLELPIEREPQPMTIQVAYADLNLP